MGKIAALIKENTYAETIGGPDYDMDGYETYIRGREKAETEIKKWFLSMLLDAANSNLSSYDLVKEIRRI